MTNQLAEHKLVTVADLLHRLGDVSADRVRFHPIPGTATAEDVVAAREKEDVLCELVDGVLVQKAGGFLESVVATAVIAAVRDAVVPGRLGIVVGAGAAFRLGPALVRSSDVAYIAWDRLPGRRLPEEQIPSLVPDLTVDVLSRDNKPGEIARKLREYFAAGVRRAGVIDPRRWTCAFYTRAEEHVLVTESEMLTGGDVLPDFRLPLAALLEELGRTADADGLDSLAD